MPHIAWPIYMHVIIAVQCWFTCISAIVPDHDHYCINHDITRLLLLMIIDSGKKCTISIIDKQNIMINRQNRLLPIPSS